MLVKTNNQLDAEVAELKIKLAEAQRARDRMGQVIADAADAIKELVRVIKLFNELYMHCIN